MYLEQARLAAQRLLGNLTTANILNLAALWVLYRLGLALYNISWFHPLYHFPGPKFAAMSFLCEFYYDVVLSGRYTRRIEQMHQKYGMKPLITSLVELTSAEMTRRPHCTHKP